MHQSAIKFHLKKKLGISVQTISCILLMRGAKCLQTCRTESRGLDLVWTLQTFINISHVGSSVPIAGLYKYHKLHLCYLS